MALGSLADAIAYEESGGDYGAVGKSTSSGDRAYGKYQVMGSNIPQWTREALGIPLTPEQFLNSPKAQDAVSRAKLGQYLSSTGSPADAASMWFTGKSASQGANLKDINGTSGAQYVKNVTQRMGPTGAAALSSVPNTDFLGSAQSPAVDAAVGAAASGIAPKATAPLTIAPTLLNAPTNDFLGAAAPETTPTLPVASQGSQWAGAIPIIPHSIEGPAPTNDVVDDVVDPNDPVRQQLATAGRIALRYGTGQVAGIPGAIAQDWRNGNALNEAGNAQLRAGNELPSFPGLDPKSWSAGGIINSLSGIAGQVMSPLTGVTRQLVEQPVTEATGNPEIGERAGIVANSLALPLIGRAAEGVPNALSNATLGSLPSEDAQLAQAATQKYGIPLTAPQLSTSQGLKVAGSTINKLPLSGAGDQIAAQQTAFNRAAIREMGESSDRATPDVMNAARKRIGSYYDSVAQNTDLKIDPQFGQDIHDVLNEASQVLPKSEVEPLLKQAQNIIEKIDPNTKTISGSTYQALTNTGAPLDNLAGSSNPNVARYANQLKKSLDSALERSATPDQQALLKTADQQWAAMRTIQPIVAKSPTGDISPALLAGRVNASTGNGMAFGYGGNLGELARIGQRFLKEPGSSNTAERGATMMALAKASAIPAAAFGASHYGLLNALTAAGSIPATLALGRVAGGVLRSPSLANALIRRSLNPAQSPVFRPGLGALSAGAGIFNEPVNALGAPNQ